MLDPSSDSLRANQLALEFNSIIKEDSLTFQRVQHLLSQKSGKSFNKLLLNEMFRQIDCDDSSIISPNDFIVAYLRTEAYLISSIKELKEKIKNKRLKVTENRRKIIELKGNSSKPALIIKIHEAKDLKIASTYIISVAVSCQDVAFNTKLIYNSINPVWEEEFTLSLEEPYGLVCFKALDNESPIGECLVDLADHQDQKKSTKDFDLYYNGNVSGAITISLHLVVDKIEYIRSIIKELENDIELDESKVNSFERFLNDLVTPLNSTTTSVDRVFGLRDMEMNFSKTMDSIGEKTFGKELPWNKATIFCIGLYIILSILSTFFRTNFLDVRNK
jgi:C2 domain